MIEIVCTGCTNHCCGQNPHLTPVLLPSEEEKFKQHSRSVQTAHRTMQVLAKKKNNNCVFLDDKTMQCTIYEERPLECRLYPFLLDFSKGKPDFKLDEKSCPHLATLVSDKEKILSFIREHKFPADWIKGYDALENF